MRSSRGGCAGVLVRVAFLLLLVAGGFAAFRLFRPYQGFTGDVFVDFARGTSSEQMADRLAQVGVVRSRWDFLLARLVQRGRVLQAGEYRFRAAATPMEVFDRIARGDIFYHVLVIPEGKNIFDIAAAVEQLGLFSGAKFLEVAHNPALVRDLDPQAPSLEGYLFPDTYRLSRHTTPEQLCQRMIAKFREVWQGLSPKADVHRTVTLASLVEKEGKLPPERPQISAVFQNRLRIGMKLDCDPTTIYAALLNNRYRGTIYRSDLASTDPYNTYQHPGLPPGPIANPGVASLKAALEPAVSDAIFFVARPDGSGGHVFTNNIADHQAAVTKYRHAQQK